MIVLALIVLMLVATRAAASLDGQHPDARDAVRYANALAGCDDDTDDTDDRDDDTELDEPCEPIAGERAVEPAGDARDATRGETDDDNARWVGDVSLDELEADAMAMIDDEVDEDAIRTGLAFTSATFDDAAAMRDLGERHHRPSRWGRVDLTVAWRRAWSMSRVDERSDALWLYATWRR